MGVDPRQMTFRELSLMATARERSEWRRTVSVVQHVCRSLTGELTPVVGIAPAGLFAIDEPSQAEELPGLDAGTAEEVEKAKWDFLCDGLMSVKGKRDGK